MRTHIVTSVLLNNKIENHYNEYKDIRVKELMLIKQESENNMNEFELLEKVIKLDSYMSSYDLLIEKQKFLNMKEFQAGNDMDYSYLKGLHSFIHENKN